jgi:hypothetical protein
MLAALVTRIKKPRRKPDNGPIRVVGPDGSERMVAPGQLEAENELRRAREAREMRRQQELFALRRGDIVTVRQTTATLADPRLRWYAETGLWWFTARVNGPERTITAKTIIIERKCEEDFAFDVIRTYSPTSPNDVHEADQYRRALRMPLPTRRTRTFRQGAPLVTPPQLSRNQRDLLARAEPSCIGYMSGCTCARCQSVDRIAA